MTPKTTTIDGYAVELELDVDYGDGPTTQCWVSTKRGTAEYNGSLALLMSVGELGGGEKGDIAVPEDTVDKIVKWAEENGY